MNSQIHSSGQMARSSAAPRSSASSQTNPHHLAGRRHPARAEQRAGRPALPLHDPSDHRADPGITPSSAYRPWQADQPGSSRTSLMAFHSSTTVLPQWSGPVSVLVHDGSGTDPIFGPAVMRLSELVSVGRRTRSGSSLRAPSGAGFGCSRSSILRCGRARRPWKGTMTRSGIPGGAGC